MSQEDDVSHNNVRCIVQKVLENLGIKDCTLDIEPGSVRGDNYLGVISRVTVAGQDKSGKNTTLNLVVKSAPANVYLRTIMPIHMIYAREIYLYSKVFPEFKRIQDERAVLKPLKCFAGHYGATSDDANEALIMEDMKVSGYKMVDRSEPLDYNHALLVIKEYGKLHALSYALRDQKPELFQELVDNTQEHFFKSFDESASSRTSMRYYIKRALNAFDPIKHKEAYEKLDDFSTRLYSTLERVLRCDFAGKYAVVGHGDSWINNMLFKYESSAPSAVCFLDWQLARAGSPALDLSYFIFTCTDGKLRAQHYDSLIQEYYSSLSSFLRELGSDPDSMFPFEILQKHLKTFSVYGLCLSIIALYLMTMDIEDLPDMRNVSNKPNAQSNWKHESKIPAKFYERVKDVVLDFVSYGYDV